jgi:hypothetical protein
MKYSIRLLENTSQNRALSNSKMKYSFLKFQYGNFENPFASLKGRMPKKGRSRPLLEGEIRRNSL